MSVEIWPPISPDELKIQEDATQARELIWLLTSLRSTLAELRGGLEDCAALLTPPPPPPPAAHGSGHDAAGSSSGGTYSHGSTLALTTPRNETVKGHTTRVGTQLVRGVVHLKLRTLPPQTLSLDPSRPVRVPALARLDALLARAVGLCLDLEEHERRPGSSPPSAPYLAARLRLLAQHIADAAALVRGPHRPSRPLSSTPTPTSASTTSFTQETGQQQQQKPPPPPKPDTAWTTCSVSLGHFTPPISRNLSLYVTVQDACLVLYLRALEPADAPVNFGTKLALAIGTTRRLEHDEADKVFSYRCDEESYMEGAEPPHETGGSSGRGGGGGGGKEKEVEVYVREKVRVESPDPSLLSLSAKLNALSNTLSLARHNLAAVMGEELED